jgi:NADP-dependent 3-hydroxy acid dehydrogenase YdfG
MSVPMIEHKSVLVTGCSSGIGLATAELLRTQGWTVFPTARKVEDLERLKRAGFEAVELDLSSSESIRSARAVIMEKTEGKLGA